MQVDCFFPFFVYNSIMEIIINESIQLKIINRCHYPKDIETKVYLSFFIKGTFTNEEKSVYDLYRYLFQS